MLDFCSYSILPAGCKAYGRELTPEKLERWVKMWSYAIQDVECFLVLAGSLTAEVKGISEAGATAQSRRVTAIADAELLLYGAAFSRQYTLPPLMAGVSPAVISHVASTFLNIHPSVIVSGLLEVPSFPYIEIEPSCFGPANCLSTGKAMDLNRVECLWQKGFEIGERLVNPLLVAECVPGGTTTALAVLTALGMTLKNIISGSNRIPPMRLKHTLIEKGLALAGIGTNSSPLEILAAVGDPFQAVAVGLLLGARKAKVPVLLGGGSQMMAVLAVALETIDANLRPNFVEEISIGTTGWLAQERTSSDQKESSFASLMKIVESRFKVSLLGLASGLRFDASSKKVLRDYEIGFIKEGVGAGALSLLALVNGFSCEQLIKECECVVDQLEN